MSANRDLDDSRSKPTGRVSLRPVTGADWGRIETWLRRPDIQRWWGNAATAVAEIRLVLDSQSALAMMIEEDGRPVGYAHAIGAGVWGALPDGMPAGTWDADIFVGEPDRRGAGIGQMALRLLVDEVFSTTLAPAISVFTSIRNEAATRAYEACGFRWVRVIEDPIFGPSWLMLRDRTAPD